MKRFLAKLNLLKHLIVHFIRQIRYLFIPRESQLSRFRQNYAVDHPLWFAEPGDQELLEGASRCIHCGSCALDCAMLIQNPGLLFKPSWIPLSVSRYNPDLEIAAKVADVCARCTGCTVECPTQVPIPQLSKFVLKKVEQWRREKSVSL